MNTFSIYIDGIPSFSLDIFREMKISEVKKQLSQFEKYDIKMFLNKNSELKVFDTSKYDDIDFSSVFDKIDKGVIYLTKRMLGKIRIAQQAKGKPYPNVKGYENIPCWSRGKGDWKLLSPFYLKFEGGAIFENFWQSFKVWDTVAKQKNKNWEWPAEKHVDNDVPNERWYKWHEALLHHDKPVRRPNGKAIPLYAW